MFHWSCLLDALSVCRRCFIKSLFHSRWTYLFSFQVIFCKLYLVLWLSVNTIRYFYFFFYVSYIWTYYFIQHQMTYFKSPAYHLQEKKVILKFCNSCRPTTANIIENYLCRWFFYANFARFFRPAVLLNTTYKQWEALWIKFTGLN